MAECNEYYPISDEQIEDLIKQGCFCNDWSKVFVTDCFDSSAVRNTTFEGSILIGSNTGQISDLCGNRKSCGIYNAIIKNCSIGNGCRISNIGVHISGYNIDDHVCIEDISRLEACPGAAFGNGVEVSVINEEGGREVTLFDGLSAQFAYIQSLHRYRDRVSEKLSELAGYYVNSIAGSRGLIGEGVKISSSGQIVDVNIGNSAVINGALRLINGTILSSPDAPTYIDSDVVGEDFIIAEGASVDCGAVLEKVYIGQACEIGNGFFAENCLFFANSKMFGGEGCSVFAGPYTVSHHKSTLLIAGLFSFYNAGSGTNQSNHMYRLGPSHEGKLLRGAKTGSNSYMLWPSVIGAFSTVLGKHTSFFDASKFPFSRFVAGIDGKNYVIPGVELTGCGIVRDGLKWPARDKRGESKRDAVSFEVISPYTVGTIIQACKLLEEVEQSETQSPQETILINGMYIKKYDAVNGLNLYRNTVELYLLEKLFEKLEASSLAVDDNAVYSLRWVDIAGMLTPYERLKSLWFAIENDKFNSIDDFHTETAHMHESYEIDEWAWVARQCSEVLNIDINKLSGDDIDSICKRIIELKTARVHAIASDAEKEFCERSQIGFGIDGDEDDIENDFIKVNGEIEDNSLIKYLRNELDILKDRYESLKTCSSTVYDMSSKRQKTAQSRRKI